MSLSALLQTLNEPVQEKEAPTYSQKDTEGLSLKAVLQSGRLKLTKAATPRPQGRTFRPSGITYSYCRRAKVLHLAERITLVDKPPTPKQQFGFDMGKAAHVLIQTYFWDIGILKGTFKCIKCNRLYPDLIAPTVCPSGKKTHERKHLVYKEVKMQQPEYKVSGYCDGILQYPSGELHLMDIKTIHNRTLKSHDRQFCFEDLEGGPNPNQVVQVQLYMWMSGIQHGHLLYVAKNDYQIKSFYIPYDYGVLEPYLKEIKHLLQLSEDLKAGKKIELPAPCALASCNCHEFLV